jgi:membrane-associated phospholipid phosphatase
VIRVSPGGLADNRLSRLVARTRSAAHAGEVGGRLAPLVEVAGLVLVVLLFSGLHAAAGQDVGAATANAVDLQSVERAHHLNFELRANQWLTGHPALIQPAVYYYRLYYVVIISVLVWVFARHRDVYVKVRRILVAMTMIVLPVFWALPTSPPRFALPGIVDVVAQHDILGAHASRENGQNLYSSMPSMHVGWSLWCAYAVWYALRGPHPRLALLPWIFPLGMAAVVLTTGNHYVLDIAGSVALLAISITAMSAWARRRRTSRWS